MTTRARGCWPSGDSASRRIESGALTRSTPVKPLRSRPSWTTTSARVRRSVNSCQRTSRSSSARRASSGTGWLAGAVAHPPASTSRPRRLLRRLRATLGPTPAILEVVDLLLDPFGGRVELQGLLPGGERLGLEAVLQIGIAEVIVDHRVGVLRLLDGALELLQGLEIAPLLVVRPGVLGVERDHLPKRPNGVVELRLLLEDDAELKVEVLVLVIEAEALLEGLRGALVLFRAKVRGAEVEEELGSLRLEVDGVAENRDRLVVVFGPPVQKPELDAGVDRARVDPEDALELGAGLGVFAGVHVRGGEEVPRAEVRRL